MAQKCKKCFFNLDILFTVLAKLKICYVQHLVGVFLYLKANILSHQRNISISESENSGYDMIRYSVYI